MNNTLNKAVENTGPNGHLAKDSATSAPASKQGRSDQARLARMLRRGELGQNLVEWELELKKHADLLGKAIVLLLEHRSYGTIVEVAPRVISLLRQCYPVDAPERQTILCHIADAYEQTDQHAVEKNLRPPKPSAHMQGTEQTKGSLETGLETLDPNHPETPYTLDDVGRVLGALGEHDQARRCLEWSMGIRRHLLGEEHPDFARSLNNLAGLYASMGWYEEAEPLYEQAVAILRQVLGEQHPCFATAFKNLGTVCNETGRYEEARQLLRKGLDTLRLAVDEYETSGVNQQSSTPSLMRPHGFERPERSEWLPATALDNEHSETTEKEPSSRRRLWEIPPDDKRCEWETGNPSPADDQPARIQAEWRTEGLLRVGVSGFLRVGEEANLEVRWLSEDGTEKASGKPRNEFSGVAELKPKDGKPPQPSDALLIRHTWKPGTGSGWIVQINVTF